MKVPDIKQIINAAQELAQKRARILQTNPEIHGINPKGIIEETGEVIELPRFSSIEMQTAQKMNKIALRQAKTGIQRTFTKATPEDYARLTSTRIKDTYARAEWTNPKDGKVYHLLKQGETEDGKVIVRILDADGVFVKEAELTPKVIAIPDFFEDFNKGCFGLSHGDVVMTFARRHNPFATYVPFKINYNNLYTNTELREVIDYINKGNHIDYLSGSFSNLSSNITRKAPLMLPDRYRKFSPELFDYQDLSDKGVRVILSGGNAKPEEFANIANIGSTNLASHTHIEGVGSLSSKTGKVSEFSASRNSELTQHYEVGEVTPTLTEYGINITGLPGTDIPYSSNRLKELSQNPLIGKPVDKVKALQSKIEARIKELEREKMDLYTKRLSFTELTAKTQKLNQAIHINMQRKKKLLDFSYQLIQKDGKYAVALQEITGTSISAPTRVAKLALNDMMEGII